MDLKYDFETYWSSIRPDDSFQDRKEAAEEEWDKHPEKHEAIIRWLHKHGPYSMRNPYFFIQDFKVRKPHGQPTDYRGKTIPKGVQVFSAQYNGHWGMFTAEDIKRFSLILPTS